MRTYHPPIDNRILIILLMILPVVLLADIATCLSLFDSLRSNLVRESTRSLTKAADYVVGTDSPLSLGDSEKSSNETDDDSNTVDTRCFFERAPSFSHPPSVHFFSSKFHIVGIKGCTNSIQFQLNVGSDNDDVFSDDNKNEDTTAGSTETTPSAEPEDATNATLSDYDDVLETNDLESFKVHLLDSKLYDPSLRTYFIVHGFMASWKSTWMCDLKDLILDNERANVFVVDWSGGAKPMLPLDYPAAVGNTKWVGKALGSFIDLLVNLTGQQDSSNFHLVGHSLGAHIVGFAGYQLEQMPLGRITALDPAGPCFGAGGINPSVELLEQARRTGHIAGGQRRLSQASARLVIAIHTDINRFGTREPVAHYDVYLNGGESQPGCAVTNFAEKARDLHSMDVGRILDPKITCAHASSYNTIEAWNLKVAKEQNYCYPMAYKCTSWEAFRAGECGICENGEQCQYVGLSADQLVLKAFEESQSAMEQSADAKHQADNSSETADVEPISSLVGQLDDEVNGEHWVDLLGNLQAGSLYERVLAKFRHNNHFLRSTDKHPACLYHYQLIIGSRPNETASDPEKFFVEIPLPPIETTTTTTSVETQSATGGQDDQSSARKRLVRVSHKIDPNSTNYIRNYQSLREIQPDLVELPAGLQLHSAIITFRAENNCSSVSALAWSLCKPLDDLAKLKLFASTDEQLSRVEWLAINYMSGIDLKSRRASSYSFAKPNNKRPHRVASGRKNKLLAELEPADYGTSDGSLLNSISGAYKQAVPSPVKCVLGGSIACWDDTQSLKHSLELRPLN